ncbi:hypothetical protein ACWDA3_22240 [Nonomuraea rubra]
MTFVVGGDGKAHGVSSVLTQGFDVHQPGRVVGESAGQSIHHAVQHRHILFGLHHAPTISCEWGDF